MNYFFCPTPEINTRQFVLEPEESRHIVKVLRKQVGDTLHITNGKGLLFYTEILEANPKKCTVQVNDCVKNERAAFNLYLAVAPTKRVERFQWLLEKATEIGVTRIIPLICERSERESLPLDRLNRVIQEAMKQSLQTWLPELSPPINFNTFLQDNLPHQRFIAHCEPHEKSLLLELAIKGQDSVILIGPEGDFTPGEIQAARAQNFAPISLGATRLRTETAALVACTALNLLNQS
ncbi:16S rRNA (uracil(1498)-N(3))-methyltransferase [Robiginitalea sp.]|nr:16S rRNA (uracil(1498)-N(3))-methyltransferase [Robiginitalea sp.]